MTPKQRDHKKKDLPSGKPSWGRKTTPKLSYRLNLQKPLLTMPYRLIFEHQLKEHQPLILKHQFQGAPTPILKQ